MDIKELQYEIESDHRVFINSDRTPQSFVKGIIADTLSRMKAIPKPKSGGDDSAWGKYHAQELPLFYKLLATIDAYVFLTTKKTQGELQATPGGKIELIAAALQLGASNKTTWPIIPTGTPWDGLDGKQHQPGILLFSDPVTFITEQAKKGDADFFIRLGKALAGQTKGERSFEAGYMALMYWNAFRELHQDKDSDDICHEPSLYRFVYLHLKKAGVSVPQKTADFTYRCKNLKLLAKKSSPISFTEFIFSL